MNRAEHEVAGFGGVDGRLERIAVAHFAHQDHVRVFPDRVLQRRVPVDDVEADLALVDDRLLVLEHELDRVFDREDVQGLTLVEVVEHGGDRRGLARTGNAGEDDHALVKLAQLFDGRRQPEALERWQRGVYAAGNEPRCPRCFNMLTRKRHSS